jgi:hypothetical protein
LAAHTNGNPIQLTGHKLNRKQCPAGFGFMRTSSGFTHEVVRAPAKEADIARQAMPAPPDLHEL